MSETFIEPRYMPRWANGYWRVFDTHAYSTAPDGLCHTHEQCIEECLGENERHVAQNAPKRKAKA